MTLLGMSASQRVRYEILQTVLTILIFGSLFFGMIWATKPDESKIAEEPKVVMTEADKDWIDTQIGWELEKRGLHVFVIGTWSPDKEAHVMRMAKVGVIVAASKEEAEGILKERK